MSAIRVIHMRFMIRFVTHSESPSESQNESQAGESQIESWFKLSCQVADN